MGGHPAILQQSLQGDRVTWGNGRNPMQYVRQVWPHVYAVPPGTLHQRVERRRRLAAFVATEMHMVLATEMADRVKDWTTRFDAMMIECKWVWQERWNDAFTPKNK